MPIISKGNQCITFINTFTVEPEDQQRLIDILTQVTETSIRHRPGFISASFHRSLDGSKVIAYAQWRSLADYEAMRREPSPLGDILSFATFDFGIYEVAATFSADGS